MWLSQSFNDANRAWALARRSAQAKAKREGLKVPADTDLNYQAGRWRQKADHYLRAIPARQRVDLGHGQSVTITTSGWQALLDTPIAAMVRAMDEEMAAVAFKVWNDAPVRSGLFRSRYAVQWRVEGDKLISALVNDTPYAKINSKGNGKGRLKNLSQATRLTRDAAIKVGLQVVDTLKRAG